MKEESHSFFCDAGYYAYDIQKNLPSTNLFDFAACNGMKRIRRRMF